MRSKCSGFFWAAQLLAAQLLLAAEGRGGTSPRPGGATDNGSHAAIVRSALPASRISISPSGVQATDTATSSKIGVHVCTLRDHDTHKPAESLNAFWTFLVSVIAGVIGYLLATFGMEPIIHYVRLKEEIAADIVYYANAFDDKDSRDLMQPAIRRRAAELIACYYRLPALFKWLLGKRGENPAKAASELVGLSNQIDSDGALRRISAIQHALRFPLLV